MHSKLFPELLAFIHGDLCCRIKKSEILLVSLSLSGITISGFIRKIHNLHITYRNNPQDRTQLLS
jgi:hypothetical protein